MNVFFKLGDTVVTPALNGDPGWSYPELRHPALQHWNIPVEERAISIDEIVEAHRAC